MKKLLQLMLECQAVNLFSFKQRLQDTLSGPYDKDHGLKCLDHQIAKVLDYQRKILLYIDEESVSTSPEGSHCDRQKQDDMCSGDCSNCSNFLASVGINTDDLHKYLDELWNLTVRTGDPPSRASEAVFPRRILDEIPERFQD